MADIPQEVREAAENAAASRNYENLCRAFAEQAIQETQP